MRGAFLTGPLIVSLFVPAACSSSDDATPAVRLAADAGADAAQATETGGNTPPPPPPAGCVDDADSKSPDAAACVADSFAVFVDALAGSDTDDGTKAKPKKTIAAALSTAKSANKHRIYLCGSGPYGEALAPDFGVYIIGGHTCGSWSYDGTRGRIAPAMAGPVLRVSSVSELVALSDVELLPLDTIDDGSSRIGIFASQSKLRITRVAVTASSGTSGKDGAAGIPGTYTTSTVPGSGDASALGGPGWCTCDTSTVQTRGGDGGDIEIDSGGTGSPQYAGIPGGGVQGGNGQKGADAPPSGNGETPTVRGVLSEATWLGSSGKDATENGKIGQGGGGGDCSGCGLNGSGGYGACGGCGGSAGKGGGAGGSSFAIVLVNTPLNAVESALSAGAGGAGGKGGSGGPGKAGGLGWASNTTKGGDGGRGADGGSGAGGAGGNSAGILFSGDAPVLDASTLEHITIGQPGKGGAGGVATNGGLDGKADKILDYGKL